MPGKYEIKESSAGFHFVLKAANGEVICKSQIYKSLDSCNGGIESVRNNAPKAKLEDQTTEEVKTETNPKFEIYKDKAGEYRFRLKARNGENIAASEGYSSKSGCMNGIESVRKNSITETVIKIEK